MPAVSPITHLKRAFAWNLAKTIPSTEEVAELAASGTTDATAQRYAVWRRSLLLTALVPTVLSVILAGIDMLQSGLGEMTMLGKVFELAWVVALAGLSVACVVGIFSWKKPGKSAMILAIAWLTSFLLPIITALVPSSALYHVEPLNAATAQKIGKTIAGGKSAQSKTPTKPAVKADPDEEEEEEAPKVTVEADLDPATLEKMQAMQELAVEFALSGSSYLLLLPAVLSVIPGAVNGCLRIKSLLPASQISGWLLVCAAPAFLLFWAVILVIANHAARSPLLVFGVILWAGAPIWYSIRGKVFVSSQITEADATQIGGVKRLVLITTLIGLAFLLAFVTQSKVIGLKIIGFDRSAAVTTKLNEAFDADDELDIEEVQMAIAKSKSFVYAFDMSSWRFIVDFLAKLLIVTALFADLVLRATVSAWRNERALRSGKGSAPFDEAMMATQTVVEKT